MPMEKKHWRRTRQHSYAADDGRCLCRRPEKAAKAETYANKVVTLVGPNPDTKEKKSYAGLAHISLGHAELNQEKLVPAVTDLKGCERCCKTIPRTNNRRCFTWAMPTPSKITKLTQSRRCRRLRASDGPYQGPAKELLAKISAAGAPRKDKISAALAQR